MLFRTRYNVLFRQFRLLTAQAGSIPAAIRLIFENCYKRIFLCFSYLRLRRRFHLSAELHALQGRNTSCEAASRRNEKKAQQRRPPPAADTGRSCWGRGQQDTSAAQGTKWTLGIATRLSAAAGFFPFRLLLRDYQGRAALDSCLLRLESSGCFSGSLLARKRELSLTATAIYPAQQARAAVHKKSTPHSKKAPHRGAFCSIIFCGSDSSAAGSASRRRPPS